jgi:HAD superfamily hydrolase (TIGR01509 family)
MSFQAIIFDFNGVLLWDSDLHESAWNDVSRRLRGRPFSQEEFAQHVHGRTNQRILRYLLQRPVPDEEAEQLADEKEQLYRAACLARPERLRLSPGAETLLEWLQEHDIRRTIATSSAAVNMGFYLEHLPLDRWFDTGRILYDDGSRPGKPAPDIYLDAAAALDQPPAACVVVEDAPSGIRAAVDAGIGHVIALGAADLADIDGVDTVIARLDQVPRSLWQ